MENSNMSKKVALVFLLLAIPVVILFILILRSGNKSSTGSAKKTTVPTQDQSGFLPTQYPVHKNITTTIFWIGEDSSSSNEFISNNQSAWDKDWVKHFGGTDSPRNRNGYLPADFQPLENPFYFALPYDDLDDNGNRKDNATSVVYWSKEKDWREEESMIKNQWIKITKDNRDAYAQWEDVGPFESDDASYVFGNQLPKSTTNENAGLDVSPAVRDYLNISGMDQTDWQFVPQSIVPDGPWKQTVTTSQVNF